MELSCEVNRQTSSIFPTEECETIQTVKRMRAQTQKTKRQKEYKLQRNGKGNSGREIFRWTIKRWASDIRSCDALCVNAYHLLYSVLQPVTNIEIPTSKPASYLWNSVDRSKFHTFCLRFALFISYASFREKKNWKILMENGKSYSTFAHSSKPAAATAAVTAAEWPLHQCSTHAQNTWINNQAKSPCSANDPFDVIGIVPVNEHWEITAFAHRFTLSLSLSRYLSVSPYFLWAIPHGSVY